MDKKNNRALQKRMEGEIRYRLARLLLLNIQAAGLAEESEVEAVRKKALRKYKPLTVQLEDGDKTEQS
jgi:hypothetical protein